MFIKKKNIYILIGLPGCGKTTWATNFYLNHSETIIISPDDFRTSFNGGRYIFDPNKEKFLINSCLDILRKSLKFYDNIILDEVTMILTRYKRNCLIKNVRKRNTKIIGVIFPFSEYNKKIRMKNSRGYSPELWAQTFDRMSSIFETVTPEEDFDEIIQLSSFEER